MRYTQIIPFDVCNGEGVGMSLFVQGCSFRCKGCFNSETWDYYGGKEWTEEIRNKFFELIDRPYIKRISILGGEPLADANVASIYELIHDIFNIYGYEKEIWIYTGYTFEDIFHEGFNNELSMNDFYRKKILQIPNVKVCVDGRYIEKERDITLKFRGSKNQRIIDVQKSLKENKVILYKE